MDVAVVVIHHAAPDWCASSTSAIAASTDLEVQLVVVDNSGDLDPTRHPEGVTVLAPSTNLGFAGGANHGIAHALATWPDLDHVVVCAHDFHPKPSALARLRAALLDDPDIGIAGPVITAPTPEAGGTWNGSAARRWPTLVAEGGSYRDVDWISGTCMAIRVACLREIGGFDARLGSYAEDVDICLRASDGGWRVAVVPDAVAHGLGSSSPDRTRLAARNAVLIVAKRRGQSAARLATFRYVLRAVRSTGAAFLFWRTLDRRQESRRFARGNWHAVTDLVRSTQIEAMAAAPEAVHRF